MSLYKRGGVYWSYLFQNGIRYQQSTGTGNLRKARLIEQHFRDELNLRRHQIVEPTPQMTFGELAARFLAEGDRKEWHIDRLKVLLPFWTDIPIGQIHKSMTADYRRRRHAAKQITDTTVNRDLEALRHILFWAVDEGLLTANPLGRLRLVPERRKPRSVIGIEEEFKLLAAAASHLVPIIIMALDTGMRRGEIFHQRREHVDLARNLLFVTQSKTAGGEGREIPLTERVNRLLHAYPSGKGLIFTYEGRPMRQIKTAWKAAIRRAGIRYYRFHDLRHSFNTRLMEAGVMQEVRKTLMGHSSGEDINATYTHIELPVKREAIRKLEVWIANKQLQLKQKGESHDSSEDSRRTRNLASGSSSGDRPDTTEAVEEKIAGGHRA